MAPKNSVLDDLRTQTLSHASNEERVEVNQRHLIDKILARYSTEYVVYRELMQNSDDAAAKKVEIIFETESPSDNEAVPNLSTKITRVTFKNSGMDFRQEDWNRLKKIAEGNPDDSKIGAFGVGFYSLFSICEEPFISSGKECMAFYWRKDQLYAKRGPIPEEKQSKGWTTFLLDLRVPMDMLDMDEFGSFIARALGFTVKLCDVTVYLDHHRLLSINKTVLESRPMTIPNAICTTSPLKIFTLKSVELQGVQMDAAQLVVSEQTREVRTIQSQIVLRTASGNLGVEVSKEFAAEMERTTKKYPPEQTTIRLLYRGYDEPETSTDNKTVFKNLLPFPEQGRIFIGFPTHQTTGFCGHVAGRFIPTVERESLDFVIECLRDWNHDLLSVTGSLSRMMYEDELVQIGNIYNKDVLSHHKSDRTEDESTAKAREELENRSLHALKTFQLNRSTPSPLVGEYIDAYFFKMSTLGLSVLSSHGVRELSTVRIPDPTMSAFLESLPVLPSSVYSGSREFMDKLEKAGKVQRISFGDVVGELKGRTLTKAQMVAMLRWWVNHKSRNGVSNEDIQTLLQTALVHSGDSALPLSTFQWFANPTLGAIDMPLPPMTLPYDITKTFEASELKAISPVWQELSLHEWTAYVIEKPDFETSPDFAEKALHVLSDGWNEVPVDSQNEIIAHLVNKKCIPTKLGMRTANESYFDTVDLFTDLPVMVFAKQPLEKLLLDLGARQSVEIQLVFDRLVDVGSWDHMRLVGYLVSVRSKLSPDDIKDLQTRSIFPRADQPTVSSTQPVNRHLANTLYAPTEAHIALGLPLIDWRGDWNERSDEASILFDLGLGKEPRMNDLLERAALPYGQETREKARQFFVSNFERLYHDQYNASIDMVFLPTTYGSIQTRLGCFWNENCGIMGFPILQKDWRNYATLLGIQENPSPEELLETLLKSPPTSRDKARQVFEYLFSVQAKFLDEQWTALKTEKFIPLDDTGKLMADPQGCYFYREDLPYRDLLATVDFGQSANRFLKECGVKEDPSPMDLAQLIARSPEKFLLHEGVNGYMSILRQIATHLDVIKSNESLLDEMKKAPFLLGEQRISQDDDAASFPSKTMADGGKGTDFIHSEQDESTGQIVRYKLDLAVKIYLVDDTVLQQIFTPFCAPMEDLLETLYESLGSTSISKQVEDTFEPIGKRENTARSTALHELIVERAPLLLNGHQGKYLKFDQAWLETELKVRQLPELRLHRKFVPTGLTKLQGTTACIVQDRKNVHYLLVTAQEEMDYFDIADALAKLLLKKNKKKKLNDTFMWSNLLSSSLQSLKRKGFQVDRILKAKNLKAMAAAAAATSATSAVKPISPAPTTNQGVTSISGPQTPTLQRLLEQSLRNAIVNCRPHNKSNLRGESTVSQVPKALTDSYCERIPAQSLKEAGAVGDLKFYIHEECNEQIMTDENQKSMARFASLLTILARNVFGLRPATMHVMYDTKGQTIAFNHEGSLFFNWRYYVSLGHDEGAGLADKKVQGRSIKARDEGLIYWFFAIAHELAHNFVDVHDSTHGYYMSSFCEQYLPAFMAVMASSPKATA